MKTNSLKKFFVVTLTMMFLTCFIGTASAAKREIEAEFTDMKVTVNGKPVAMTDSLGNEAEPITYNGTVYIPAATVASAMGAKVSYNSKINTLEITNAPLPSNFTITSTPKPISEAGTDLSKLTLLYQSGSQSYKWNGFRTITDTYGDTHSNVNLISFYSPSTATQTFALNGKYKQVEGKFIISNDTALSYSDNVYCYISADGVDIFDKRMNRSDEPMNFDLDIGNVKKISIRIKSSSYTNVIAGFKATFE